MSTRTAHSLDSLQAAAIDALRRYQSAPSGQGTPHLRAAAEALFEARGHFLTKDGEPDWRGGTYANRRFVRETMTLANVPPEEATTTQAAIRYHVGAVMRERLDEDTLDAIGVRRDSPRERSVAKRAKAAETLSLFGGGPMIDDPAEVARALELVRVMLARVDAEAMHKAPKRQRSALVAAVDAVAEGLGTLL